MELTHGRPADCAGREARETAVYDLLDRLAIPYQRIDHEETNTMEACSEVDKVLGVTICKNLFLCNRQETNFYMLMMPGTKPFKTSVVSKLVSSARLSFADARYMEAFLHIRPGAVSVMLIDREVAESEFLGCHPCVSTTSLKLRTQDMLTTFLPATGHEPIVLDLPWDA